MTNNDEAKRIASIISAVYTLEQKYELACIYGIVVTIVAIILAFKAFV